MCTLIKAIWILLADCITTEGLTLANKLLKKFVLLVEEYYGNICSLQMNIYAYICVFGNL